MFEGWVSPFEAENRREEDRNTAWNAVREHPDAAALMAGLSMLANNNGRNSFGNLVGRAGVDTLNGLGAMEQTLSRTRRSGEKDRVPEESAEPASAAVSDDKAGAAGFAGAAAGNAGAAGNAAGAGVGASGPAGQFGVSGQAVGNAAGVVGASGQTGVSGAVAGRTSLRRGVRPRRVRNLPFGASR